MTQIERSYVEQGYRLPDGLTWDTVARERARWGIAAILVPEALGPGCVGWAIPYIDGQPLERP